MSKKLIKISKLCSYILRHKPEAYGLALDEQGWIRVDDLIAAIRRDVRDINRSLLEQMVDANDKKRFSFNHDGTRIRANQGHSIPVDLDLKPLQPPDVLFHGTADRFLDSIKKDGLRSRSRLHVHLSFDEKTAVKVGQRHGKPVVLKIKAGLMAEKGYRFYLSDNNVWLTEHVPADYIVFPGQ